MTKAEFQTNAQDRLVVCSQIKSKLSKVSSYTEQKFNDYKVTIRKNELSPVVKYVVDIIPDESPNFYTEYCINDCGTITIDLVHKKEKNGISYPVSTREMTTPENYQALINHLEKMRL